MIGVKPSGVRALGQSVDRRGGGMAIAKEGLVRVGMLAEGLRMR